MLGDDLKAVDGAEAGAWIEPGRGGEFGAVSLQVPKVFEAYARVFHRSTDEDGNHVTWAEVARRLGRTAHREMQWHQLVGSSDSANFTGSDWPGGRPELGEMEVEELDRLARVLADHTADPGHCFFGFCLINKSSVLETLSAEERQLPQLMLRTGRDHVVLAGPLSALVGEADRVDVAALSARFEAGEPVGREYWEDPFWREAPNLIWPGDRSWLVVSEVDFDSTLVGGRRELVDALVAAPNLEVHEVDPDTSLAAFADKRNPVAEPDEGRPLR